MLFLQLSFPEHLWFWTQIFNFITFDPTCKRAAFMRTRIIWEDIWFLIRKLWLGSLSTITRHVWLTLILPFICILTFQIDQLFFAIFITINGIYIITKSTVLFFLVILVTILDWNMSLLSCSAGCQKTVTFPSTSTIVFRQDAWFCVHQKWINSKRFLNKK